VAPSDRSPDTKLTPTAPNTVVKARYVGLDPKGPVEISVIFK
jgi:hypothetical protein